MVVDGDNLQSVDMSMLQQHAHCTFKKIKMNKIDKQKQTNTQKTPQKKKEGKKENRK